MRCTKFLHESETPVDVWAWHGMQQQQRREECGRLAGRTATPAAHLTAVAVGVASLLLPPAQTIPLATGAAAAAAATAVQVRNIRRRKR